MGSYRDNQGKRDDQIAFSEMMVSVSIIGIILLLSIRSLYYIVSSLVDYIMG